MHLLVQICFSGYFDLGFFMLMMLRMNYIEMVCDPEASELCL